MRLFQMTAESKQPTGLPVMLQQGSARLPMPTFDPPLGPSDDGQVHFALKQTALCRMLVQKFNQRRATVLPDQFILQ